MKALANLVNRSFRRFERMGEAVLGRVGPLFVALYVILVGMGMVAFFTCTFPNRLPMPNALAEIMSLPSVWHLILAVPNALWEGIVADASAMIVCFVVTLLCLYIVTMMIWSYYMACTVGPGTVQHGLPSPNRECRLGPGSRSWWRTRQYQVAAAACMKLPLDVELDMICKSLSDKNPLPETYVCGYPEEDLRCAFRFCKKCKPVTLAKALSCLPPELRWEEKINRRAGVMRQWEESALANTNTPHQVPDAPAALFHDQEDEGEHDIHAWLGDKEAKMIVYPPKPERAHHCRTCNACILKFDHHCPWLNQCVGLGNERYFILFMLWFSLGALIFAIAGWPIAYNALVNKIWMSTVFPRILYLALYAKAIVMGPAVFILALWHLYLAARNETSVESQDHSHYQKTAKERDAVFQSVYDLGWIRNLQIFFNVGPGMAASYYTLLLPVHVEPYSDGWHWAKCAGFGGQHAGIMREEEFTDDEGGPD